MQELVLVQVHRIRNRHRRRELSRTSPILRHHHKVRLEQQVQSIRNRHRHELSITSQILRHHRKVRLEQQVQSIRSRLQEPEQEQVQSIRNQKQVLVIHSLIFGIC